MVVLSLVIVCIRGSTEQSCPGCMLGSGPVHSACKGSQVLFDVVARESQKSQDTSPQHLLAVGLLGCGPHPWHSSAAV